LNEHVVDACLKMFPAHIQYLSSPTQSQQLEVVEMDPLNIQYICKPLDTVILYATHLNPEALKFVREFSNPHFQQLISKRKVESSTKPQEEIKSSRIN
jgi:hypothetical protein